MRIVIFELEDWERAAFEPLRDQHDVQLLAEPLTQETAADYADADIVSTFIYSRLDRTVLEKISQLKLIATRSTGYDHIDLEHCQENDVIVANVPSYGENTVAEHVFGLLLTISHQLDLAIDRTRKGDFSSRGLQGFDLEGKTLGVIGTGNIGRHTIRIAKGFGMKVRAYDVHPDEEAAQTLGFQYVDLDELFRHSDVISLHVPATSQTHHLLSDEQFDQMKEGVVIINTSRGDVINNRALLRGLAEGKVRGAGLDVLPEEPIIREEAELLRSVYERTHNLDSLLADQVLIRVRSVVVTPHSAFNTREAVSRILRTTLANIESYVRGERQNVVNQAASRTPQAPSGARFMIQATSPTKTDEKTICWFEDLTNDDVARVGGKNASLGEMIRELKQEGVTVPGGFATTADAFRRFIEANQLDDKIRQQIDRLHDDPDSLAQVGKAIRRLFNKSTFPDDVQESIRRAYGQLCDKHAQPDMDVAVRSSATAEDLPEASFAGQQETFLNVTGEDELLDACRKCYASLFTDRAIAYREEKGFDHLDVALSVGVQKMVRSDKAGSGVMFSIDTETGFPDVVVINAAWGLGENVVQGAINPDEYVVFKPLLNDDSLHPIIDKSRGAKEKQMVYAAGGSQTTKNIDTPKHKRQAFVLSDKEILTLARWAAAIEAHYGKPMDMEWAKDGDSGELFIVQARPETVQSQKTAQALKTYRLREQGKTLLTGLAIGQGIAAGKACVIRSADEIDRFEDGAVLVTEMTDPDWVPIMKRAAGIVTDHGGRTSHAAIVSRELGLPAAVGTGEATATIENGRQITLSCAEGDEAKIYEGALEYEEQDVSLEDIPETRTKIMMNIASPAAAFRWWRLPCEGIGLARMEFIVNNVIKIHPLALLHPDQVDDEARQQIEALTRGYDDKAQYFIDHLARGIAKIAAAQYPHPVVLRMSDFKTNEYADLIGGAPFEPHEENPMLGFRGASRYYSDRYREGFALECQAVRRVREEIGMQNVVIMIPFCRTPEEADQVLEVLAEQGLERGRDGLQVYCMAEIPSNVVLAEEFARRFDAFSIGSNDLTQLVLGVGRDSAELRDLFDERHLAVKRMISQLISVAHEHETKVGICGQAPSDYPDFAAFLVEQGIDSMSLNPDSVVQVKRRVAEVEGQMR